MKKQKSGSVTRRQMLGASLGVAAAAVGTSQVQAGSWRKDSLKGKKVLVGIGEFSEGMETCYYAIRPDMELAGAEFFDQPVVIDGKFVSSRGWPDLPEFMPAFLDVLAAAG